jgi:hypothetical protein
LVLTVSPQVSDIHNMQHEMYANHTRAFAALSNQLLQAMLFLKEFTDTGIGKVPPAPLPWAPISRAAQPLHTSPPTRAAAHAAA